VCQIGHEGVDLSLARSQLDDEPLDRGVEHAPAAAHDLPAHRVGLSGRDAQLEQHQLALQVLAARHVQHLHHVHELVQLVDDLLDDQVRALGDQCQPRHGRVIGRGDRERFNVVAAGREQARDPGERTGFVLQQDGNDMTHGNPGKSGWRTAPQAAE